MKKLLFVSMMAIFSTFIAVPNEAVSYYLDDELRSDSHKGFIYAEPYYLYDTLIIVPIESNDFLGPYQYDMPLSTHHYPEYDDIVMKGTMGGKWEVGDKIHYDPETHHLTNLTKNTKIFAVPGRNY